MGGVYFDLPNVINTNFQDEDVRKSIITQPDNIYLSNYELWANTDLTTTYFNSIIVTGYYHDDIKKKLDKPYICFVAKKNDGNYMKYNYIFMDNYDFHATNKDQSRFIEFNYLGWEPRKIKLEDYELNNPVYVGSIPKIRYMYRPWAWTEPGKTNHVTLISEDGSKPTDRLWFANGDLDKFLTKSENKTDDYSDVKYRNYLCTVESVDKKTNGKIKYTFKVPR